MAASDHRVHQRGRDVNDCAVCPRVFASMTSRANHERLTHPSFTPSPELARLRRRHSFRAWKLRQGPAWLWIGAANQTARRYGQPPMSVRTVLPDGPCAYCGGEATGWDHVVPLARGGAHTVANLVPSCWDCNHRKNRYPVEATPWLVHLLCGWCWTPVARKRSELRRIRTAACSPLHQRLLAMNAPLDYIARTEHDCGHVDPRYGCPDCLRRVRA